MLKLPETKKDSRSEPENRNIIERRFELSNSVLGNGTVFGNTENEARQISCEIRHNGFYRFASLRAVGLQ